MLNFFSAPTRNDLDQKVIDENISEIFSSWSFYDLVLRGFRKRFPLFSDGLKFYTKCKVDDFTKLYIIAIKLLNFFGKKKLMESYLY